MAPVREVAFELECFEWADERLEVAGHWKGLGTRRLNRPVLTVQTEGSGRPKRVVAMPGGHMAAGADTWRASFAWPGDPGEITGAALEVGGSLVVDLPLPDKRRRRRRRPAADPVDDALRAEVGLLRGQVERLRGELAGREREIIALRSQLDEGTDEEEGIPLAGADERTIEIQRLAGERDAARADLSAEVERLAGEREAADAERARFKADLDDLREAFSEAAAEAEAVRDRHREEVGALEGQLRAERAEIARLSAEAARLAAADRERAAAPPTQPMAPPAAAGPPTEAMPAPGAGDATAAGAGAGAAQSDATAADAAEAATAAAGDASGADATETLAAVDPPARDEPAGPVADAPVAPALDAPGPLRAAARPVTPAFTEEGEPGAAATGPGALQVLKERLEGLFSSNGHAPAADPEDERDHLESTGAPLPAAQRERRARAGRGDRRRPAQPDRGVGDADLRRPLRRGAPDRVPAVRHQRCLTAGRVRPGSSPAASRSPRCRCCCRGRSPSIRGRGSAGGGTWRGSSSTRPAGRRGSRSRSSPRPCSPPPAPPPPRSGSSSPARAACWRSPAPRRSRTASSARARRRPAAAGRRPRDRAARRPPPPCSPSR